MKLVNFSHLFTGIVYMAYLVWGSARAQYFEDPKLYFKKFDFDWINRGAFNISECLRDLMNCFELVKGDVVCQHGRYADSVCVMTRAVCHDYHLDYDSYGFHFTISEKTCIENVDQWWT